MSVPNACKLPSITCCTYCAGIVRYVNNSEIYHGKSYGKHPWIYLCGLCGAFVGSHPGTDIPLGTLADKKTREARKNAHVTFDCLWRDTGVARVALTSGLLTDLASRDSPAIWLGSTPTHATGSSRCRWLNSKLGRKYDDI